MPNATGLFSKFRRQPVTVNNANKNLERNVGIYVQSYLKNRNAPNKVPPINNYMARALHKYINTKRARVAGAVAAATGNAGATPPVQAAAASGAASTPPSAPPSNAGKNAARAAQQAGATPLQITAAAAGAAQQQAMGQNKGPNAAQQARPNASATQQAQTAAAGAAAANVNAKRAALEALLNGVTNNSITNPNGKSIAEVEKLKANLEALNINNNRKKATLNLINKRLRENVVQGGSGSANMNSLRGAVNQNINFMNTAQAAEELRRLNVLLNKVGQVNNANLQKKINNYHRRLNAKVNPSVPLTRRQALFQQGLATNLNYARFARTLVNTPNSTSIMGAIANAKSKNIRFNRNKLVTAVEKLRGFGPYANKNQKITNVVDRLSSMNAII